MAKLKSELVSKMSALITAAFGLIAALAWNDAVRSLFAEGGPLFVFAKNGPWVYALFVTIIAVIATVWISKVADKIK